MANEPTIDVAAKYVVKTFQLPAGVVTAVTPWSLGERMLETLDLFYAPGHVGLFGVNIAYGGVAILPWNQPNDFLLGDAERRCFEIGLHVSSPLTITTQNQDKKFPHAVVITAKLTELVLSAPALTSVALLPVAAFA